jgi:demethylmenaquinone methyltransferase/2-methoxy-6-polyprenyl-1,4-benzoquinol methylase
MFKRSVENLYRRRASHYDLAVAFFLWVFGFRYSAYRAHALERLFLHTGDVVVDLGCGTGLSFASILERIGPSGRLLGVDLSDAMLTRARARVARNGWDNVELIQSDLVSYGYPDHVDAVLSTGVLGYVEAPETVIAAASNALVPDGRLAIMDIKGPERWPRWLFTLLLASVAQPFGVTREYFSKRPWESVQRHFSDTTFEELYWGLVYIASGVMGRKRGNTRGITP